MTRINIITTFLHLETSKNTISRKDPVRIFEVCCRTQIVVISKKGVLILSPANTVTAIAIHPNDGGLDQGGGGGGIQLKISSLKLRLGELIERGKRLGRWVIEWMDGI